MTKALLNTHTLFKQITEGVIKEKEGTKGISFQNNIFGFEFFYSGVLKFANTGGNNTYQISVQFTPKDIQFLSDLFTSVKTDSRLQDYLAFAKTREELYGENLVKNPGMLNTLTKLNKTEFDNLKVSFNKIGNIFFKEFSKSYKTINDEQSLTPEDLEQMENSEIGAFEFEGGFIEIDQDLIKNLSMEDFRRDKHIMRFKERFNDQGDYIILKDSDTDIDFVLLKHPEYSESNLKTNIPSIRDLYDISLAPQMFELYQTVLQNFIFENDVVLSGPPGTSKTMTGDVLGYILNQPVFSFAFSDKTAEANIIGSMGNFTEEKFKSNKKDYLIGYINLLNKIQRVQTVRDSGVYIEDIYIEDLKEFRDDSVGFDLNKETKKYLNECFESKQTPDLEYAYRLECSDFFDIPMEIIKSTKEGKNLEKFDQLKNEKLATKVIWFEESPIIKGLKLGGIVVEDEVDLPKSSSVECQNSFLGKKRGLMTVNGKVFRRHPDSRILATRNGSNAIGRNELSSALKDRFSKMEVNRPNSESIIDIITLQFDNLSEIEKIKKICGGDLALKYRISKIEKVFSNMVDKSASFGKEGESVYFGVRDLKRITKAMNVMMPKIKNADQFDSVLDKTIKNTFLASLTPEDREKAKIVLEQS